MSLRNLIILLALSPMALVAQSAAPAAPASPPIQDNSFLIEEAYNPEQGIVQHIGTFRTHRGSSDFEASFTQEWPVGGITHQLSYDLFLIRSGHESGLGVRGAINFASGLQIVPGVAIPIGVGPSHGDRGVFVYLSFEHPFMRTDATRR
jgi:hypothetical protein